MMKRGWRLLLPMLPLLACLGACGDENPVAPPQNRSPVISSLFAFPIALSPGESTIVICNAEDPDGDQLVYDWLTDARLQIKGNPPWRDLLTDSPFNFQVFYHGPPSAWDSAWVECTVRDNKGGAAPRRITIQINQ